MTKPSTQGRKETNWSDLMKPQASSNLTTMQQTEHKPKLALFFGNIRPHEYNTFKDAGYKLGLFFRKHHYLPRPSVEDFEFITDFTHEMETEPLVSHYQKISQQYDIQHHINVREDTVPQFAKFAEQIGIASTAPQDAITARDKTLMKTAFKNHIGEHSTSAFALVNSATEVLEFANAHRWPLVLKPTNLHASKFVSINHNVNELMASYQHAVAQISALNRLERNLDADLKAETFTSQDETTFLQIEEFMPGTNHSVDCLIDQYGRVYATPVVDVVVGIEIGKSDFHHFARRTPSLLPAMQEQAVREMAIAGCKALNLRSCIAHVELINTVTGAQLIEIAARPGGNRAEILQLSYGIDLMTLFRELLEGNQPPETYRVLQHAAIVTPFPEKQQRMTELKFEETANKLNTLNKLIVKVQSGDEVGPALAGFTAPAYFWLNSTTSAAIEQDIANIVHSELFV